MGSFKYNGDGSWLSWRSFSASSHINRFGAIFL